MAVIVDTWLWLIDLQRYVQPLIAPPTPPQLEQDKKDVDEEFSRAFALIDQLSTDTAALKSAEEARTERLDGTLKDVENLVSDLKNASRRRDDETRRISDEVKTLKDAIPKALQGAREGNEHRLKELGTELKSLKVLLGNRLGGGAGSASPAAGRTGSPAIPGTSRPEESAAAPAAAPAAPAAAPAAPASAAAPAAPAAPATDVTAPAPTNGTDTAPTASPAPASPSPLSQLGKSASIPAWQMAAANRNNKKASVDEDSSANGDSAKSTEQSAPAS